jgi:uncharacterized protein YndB with AHSA1/START domain
MEQENEKIAEQRGEVLQITRMIDAPVHDVYVAWTKADQLAKWWGPKDFTNPVCEVDLKPGGEIRIDMKGPDGTVYPMGGIFHEIIEPQKLVFTSTAFKDANGQWQLEVFNTITLKAREDKTELTLVAEVIERTPETEASIAGMETGWNQSLDRLQDLVKAGSELKEEDNTKLEP